MCGCLGQRRDHVLSTDETARFWRERNGCDATPTASRVYDVYWDRTEVHQTDWSNCTGAPVVTYRIEGGGHTWPSGRRAPVLGRTSREIDAAAVAYAFFNAF